MVIACSTVFSDLRLPSPYNILHPALARLDFRTLLQSYKIGFFWSFAPHASQGRNSVSKSGGSERGLGRGSPLAGSRSGALVGRLGDAVPQKLKDCS